MVFGLFKRGQKTEPVKVEPSELEPPKELIPAVADDRLTKLGPMLWQDVRYGMTVDEVRGTRPDAIRSSKAEPLADGSIAELMIPHLQLGAHSYAVLFYIKAGRLTQVTIKTNGGPTLVDFRDITNALRLRYGPEVQMKESYDSFSTAEWLSADGINVMVVFQEAIDLLNVVFQYRYASAASQL